MGPVGPMLTRMLAQASSQVAQEVSKVWPSEASVQNGHTCFFALILDGRLQGQISKGCRDNNGMMGIMFKLTKTTYLPV